MRTLGFERIDWQNLVIRAPKLTQPEFTTWRLPRKDREWHSGEVVNVVLRPRTPTRVILGRAIIMKVENRDAHNISDQEARVDGFDRGYQLSSYLSKTRHRKGQPYGTPMNKLTLEWLLWYTPMIAYCSSPIDARRKYGL